MDAEAVTAWVKWAEARGVVRLTDGRTGRLLYFSQRGGQHKVLIAARHERVANDAIGCAVVPVAVAS
jgi:hypothetical protein